MKKEEFSIRSRDERGTRVRCVRWLPEGAPTAIVVLVHGMAEYIDRYDELAAYLCGLGYLVTGEDFLGHGGTAQSPEELGYFCEQDPATVLVRDVHRLKKTVQAAHPGLPVFIIGHSMGSFVVRNYLCRYGSGVDGAVIMGTGMQPRPLILFSRAVAAVSQAALGSRHRAQLINLLAFGTYNKRVPHARTPMDWLSANQENVRNYNGDPLCGFTFTANGFATLFALIDRLYQKKTVAQMPQTLPVLFVAGDEDPVGDYGRAVRRVYDSFRGELGMQDVELCLFAGDRHELVAEDDRQDVFAAIGTWLEKRRADCAGQ